jgi:hypothetical protein
MRDARKISLNNVFLLSYYPFHLECRIPAKLYRDPAEFKQAVSLALRLAHPAGCGTRDRPFS